MSEKKATKSPLKNGNKQYTLTQKEARMGGLASVKARRRKKKLAELIDVFGTLDVKDEKIIKTMKKLGIDPDDLSNDMAIVISQYRKALNGDTQAFNSIRDTRGQKPKETIEHKDITPPTPLDDLTGGKKNGKK